VSAVLTALAVADAIPGIDIIALTLTAGVLAVSAAQVWEAHQKSTAQLSDHDASKPCVDCEADIPCFTTPEGQSTKEMKDQLKGQQDTINNQSPDEMQQRLDEADARKKTTKSYRPEGDATARADARSKFFNDRTAELKKQFAVQDIGPEEAAQKANDQAAHEMKNLDATHGLDAIAGGAKSDGLTMANKSVNRSIGAQWKSRIKALKDAVKRAKAKGDKKMDVKLEPCDDGPTS
jgi:hypothetical protein